MIRTKRHHQDICPDDAFFFIHSDLFSGLPAQGPEPTIKYNL